MMTLLQLAGAAFLALASPFGVWIERRVKAWSQLRIGPHPAQPWRDLRKTWTKRPLAPRTASPYFALAPLLAVGVVASTLLVLPFDPDGSLAAGVGFLALGLLLTLHRALLVAQAYDTSTPFGGLGASRELFLGGLGEPVLLLVTAAVFLQSGTAGFPPSPLSVTDPAAWLVAAALAFLLLAEMARIPFDNPATHLELTMVHEALLLEASGWVLALHEAAAMLKQSVLAAVVVFLFLPLPPAGPLRLAILVAAVVAVSGVFALAESALAKVRLFRASHLLIMAALLGFLAAAFKLLEGHATA